MSALSFPAPGGHHAIAYEPTGWIAGQFRWRGSPAWLTGSSDAGVTVTDWGGRERFIPGVAPKVLNLPEHPFHHVLIEHLFMAGWKGVHQTKRPSKRVAEAVMAFPPGGGGQFLFTVPDRGDAVTAVAGDREYKIDADVHAIEAWLRKGVTT